MDPYSISIKEIKRDVLDWVYPYAKQGLKLGIKPFLNGIIVDYYEILTRKKCSKPCIEDNVCNPLTGRCIKEGGSAWKKVMEKYPEYRTYAKLPMERYTTGITNFSGTPWYNLVAMLYLLIKHDNDCIVLPYMSKSEKFTKKEAEKFRKKKQHHENISLRWIKSDKVISVPKDFWKKLKECDDITKRFIVFPFGYTYIDGGHANYIVYDKYTRIMERFEPHGIIIDNILDEKIVKLFIDNMGADFIKTYLRPLDFCPYLGFQNIEVLEGKKQYMDPGGFCAAWSAWYADLRLTNPQLGRKEVIELAMNKMQKSPKYFTKYIRNYAEFLVSISNILKKSKDPEVDIIKMIQKYG